MPNPTEQTSGLLPPVSTPSAADEPGLLLARWPLDARAQRQPRSVEELPPELIEVIHNPAVLEHGVPYLNTAWASNELVDSYGTRMRASTLRNYADDASNGIALQNSHRTNELPLGRTFRGRYRAGKSESASPSRTEMDFFIPPGLNVSGVNTSDVIKAIDYGSVRDVSIGFYGGELRCSLDGKPMMRDLMSLLKFGSDDDETRDPDAPCGHLPGMQYVVRDANGKKTAEKAVAVGDVEGAHCAELSLVFDGATPMAQIAGRSAPVFFKAYRMAEMDILPRSIALALEARYRGVRFPSITNPQFYLGQRSETALLMSDGSTPLVPDERAKKKKPSDDGDEDDQKDAPPWAKDDDDDDEDKKKKEKRAMPEPQQLDVNPPPSGPPPGATAVTSGETVPLSNPSASSAAADSAERAVVGLRSALVTAGLAPEGFTGDLASRFIELGRELSDLRAWADIGRAARERLVDDCRKEGIRAFGATFPESAYGAILTRGSFSELQGLHAHFTELGNGRFQGGRASIDADTPTDPPTPITSKQRVPTRAFRA